MARLNEQPMPADSFDILRRRFLRQNRDIARINSNQSLRIRALENECARLLSENLDLRGQVLSFEKELEDNKSQRIADHALQIKQKMEAQLVELGALVASFGLEPPTKRPSPVTQRRVKRAASFSRSSETSSPQPRRRPPPLSPTEAESLAVHEGRLPPIYETKTFPRQTLSGEEILALQSNDTEPAGSPELGPPPTSRLLVDDQSEPEPLSAESVDSAVKEDDVAVSNRALTASKEQAAEQSSADTSSSTASHSERPLTESKQGEAGKNGPVAKEFLPTSASISPTTTTPSAPESTPSTPTARPSTKRKYAVNDENATIQGMKTSSGHGRVLQATSKGQAEKSAPVREVKNPRSIKNLVNSRKDSSEGTGEVKNAVVTRRPLAAKSTNDDISSPRKQALANTEKTKGRNTQGINKVPPSSGRVRHRMKEPLAVPISDAPPPVTVAVVNDDKVRKSMALPTDQEDNIHTGVEQGSAQPEDMSCPSTPRSSAPLSTTATMASQRLVPAHSEGHDTPPPVDISSRGETTRPSRRARASVSYAEPNLRDKMRRPTKELFDAVSGEGKFSQRKSLQIQQSGQSEDRESEAGTNAEPRRPTDEHKSATLQQEGQISQLDKQKPHSSTDDVQEAAIASGVAANADANSQNSHSASEDPYEFTVASSSLSQDAESEESAAGSGKGKASKKPGTSSSTQSKATGKASRRASSAMSREDRPSATRKRASMISMKRGSMLDDDEDDPADSSYEPPAEKNDVPATEERTTSTRDRVSRRRSMML